MFLSAFPAKPKTDLDWMKSVRYEHLEKEFLFVRRNFSDLPLTTLAEILEGYKNSSGPVFPKHSPTDSPAWAKISALDGFPVRFMILVMALFPPMERNRLNPRDLRLFYQSMTGKNSTRRSILAAAWALSITLPLGDTEDEDVPTTTPKATSKPDLLGAFKGISGSMRTAPARSASEMVSEMSQRGISPATSTTAKEMFSTVNPTAEIPLSAPEVSKLEAPPEEVLKIEEGVCADLNMETPMWQEPHKPILGVNFYPPVNPLEAEVAALRLKVEALTLEIQSRKITDVATALSVLHKAGAHFSISL